MEFEHPHFGEPHPDAHAKLARNNEKLAEELEDLTNECDSSAIKHRLIEMQECVEGIAKHHRAISEGYGN